MTLLGKSPFKVIFDEVSNFSHLLIFNLLWYTQIQLQAKFSEWSRKYFFEGHPFGKKVRWMYVLESQKIFISYYAIFYETIFLFHLNIENLHSETSYGRAYIDL